jgi:hypothetical protein
MSLCLNDAELSALNGLSPVYIVIYVMGIRRHMDYETGYVGAGKGNYRRRISWQALRESLYVEPRRGVKTCELPSKDKVRRMAKQLKKVGLISIESTEEFLIFKCLLATSDRSAQNKAAISAHPPVNTQAAILPFPKTPESSGVNIAAHEKADTQAARGENAKAAIQPVTGKKKKTITDVIVKKEKRACQMPDDFCVTDHHRQLAIENGWPSPDEEFEGFKDRHLSLGSRFVDWDRALYTWLRNAKKFNARNGGQYGNSNQQLNRRDSAILATLKVCAEVNRLNEHTLVGEQSL